VLSQAIWPDNKYNEVFKLEISADMFVWPAFASAAHTCFILFMAQCLKAMKNVDRGLLLLPEHINTRLYGRTLNIKFRSISM
jgi:hypothetical protein